MARVFTTTFSYKSQPYHALIIISGQQGQQTFDIRTHDPALRSLIPGGRFLYIGKEGYKTLKIYEDAGTKELIDSITDTIQSYLTGY